ncbi:hypothetical protein FISHEDRAFT_46417 [Fistulina hepatica ATCC 64428]|uniref:WD40 repeat-like protein n=1 Tax=Fistulina hepatica ATCC 64428 TaxID=1128425 RepID=A0A0D7AAC2_9AGAR|nr:hypothetical protein FISHEDRAFT_46417 [Fistulina hepatica ATCC 64428]
MSRSLRPRTSRPNYNVLAGLEEADDDGAGPSTRFIHEEEDSDSDFSEANKRKQSESSDSAESGDIELDEDVPERGSEDRPVKRKNQIFSLLASTSSTAIKSMGGAILARAHKRHVLPRTSLKYARNKAQPLYAPLQRVERLVKQPSLFVPPSIHMSTNFTSNPNLNARAKKTWEHNVGAGPLWEMLEDRSWFKESGSSKEGDSAPESHRRPRAYDEVQIRDRVEILTSENAAVYLPMNDRPSICCSFGPIQEQTRLEMKLFEDVPMSKFFPESEAHVFNAGASAWGMDWCPIHPDDRKERAFKQYLAVAPLPTATYTPRVGVPVQRPSPACIQIWTLSSDDDGTCSQVACEIVICMDSGPAFDLKWCPLPTHDSISDASHGKPRKLGLLAGVFEDGSLSIFTVPEPADFEAGGAGPVYVKLPEPLVCIELEEGCCTALDWANSEVLAVGTSYGAIAVFNIRDVLHGPHQVIPEDLASLVPTHYMTVHQSAIRAVTWVRAPSSTPWKDSPGDPCVDDDPHIIVSGGYDGMEAFTDIREARRSVMNRTRDIIHTIAFSPYLSGIVTVDHDNIIKLYSMTPSTLGRSNTLMEPQGPVWSVATSDYHPQLAVGSADGSCTTTNTLRGSRKGSTIPFFVHKIYQMDYSRQLDEWRMLEHFLPQADRSTAVRMAKKSTADKNKTNPFGTGAWPCEVGVNKVVWHQGGGLGCANVLASATASGLCRVDVLRGRWNRDTIPYNGKVFMMADDVSMESSDSD